MSAFFQEGRFALVLVSRRAGQPGSAQASVPAWGIQWSVAGASSTAPRAEQELPGQTSKMVGDPAQWQADQPTYSRVVYAGITPGVNLVLDSRARGLEYTLELQAGIDPATVTMACQGAQAVRLADDGRALEIETGLGKLREQGLRCYQNGPDGPSELSSRYAFARQTGDLTWEYGFEVAGADPNLPIVIDPVIDWSTLVGGSAVEEARDSAVDSAGNVYLTGSTRSVDFPVVGGFDAILSGTADIFVTKVAADSQSLIWSTYLGGSGDDFALTMALDPANNVYVTGYTYSVDYPSGGGFDATLNGTYDAYITKIAASGAAIVYSSYIGGSIDESGWGIVVDGAGIAYLTGATQSADFPIVGGFDATRGGVWDTWIVKVSAAGSSIAWSSFLGGSVEDQGYDIAVDGLGDVYLTGWTKSADFPTPGGFDTTNAGDFDAYITKVNAAGTAIIWSTYLGGSLVDQGFRMAVDGSGNVYVAGWTNSADFTVVGSFDLTHGGDYDGWVAKLSSTGAALLWSSFIGGAAHDSCWDLALDGTGSVYLAGRTQSADFPTMGGFDTTLNGSWDGFIAQVNSAGTSLTWSSYLGGSGDDFAHGVGLHGNGVYVVGNTGSADFPLVRALDGSVGGLQDAFVVYLRDPAPPAQDDDRRRRRRGKGGCFVEGVSQWPNAAGWAWLVLVIGVAVVGRVRKCPPVLARVLQDILHPGLGKEGTAEPPGAVGDSSSTG